MKIYFICHYFHFEHEKQSNRYLNLINNLSCKKGVSIKLFTSSFYHRTKKQRDLSDSRFNSTNFQTEFIHENSYKKNVGLKRLISHYIFAKDVIKRLKKCEKPDLVFCAIPSSFLASKISIFCKQNGIKMILDVQDLWPEAFKMAFNIPIISNLLFLPISISSKNAYKNASVITGVSDTYVKKALGKSNRDHRTFYLGSNFKMFHLKNNDCKSNVIKFVYIGMLGKSYDLETVFNAFKLLKEKKCNNFVLYIYGAGYKEKKLKSYCLRNNLNVEFKGFVEYKQMMMEISECDFALNPINKYSAASIINKVCDYAGAKLPVINGQNCEEYVDLLEKYNAGLSYKSGNYLELSHILYQICTHKISSKKYKSGLEKLSKIFDSKTIYKEFADFIISNAIKQ